MKKYLLFHTVSWLIVLGLNKEEHSLIQNGSKKLTNFFKKLKPLQLKLIS